MIDTVTPIPRGISDEEFRAALIQGIADLLGLNIPKGGAAVDVWFNKTMTNFIVDGFRLLEETGPRRISIAIEYWPEK